MPIYNSQAALISTLLSQSQGTAMAPLVQGAIGSIYVIAGSDAEFDPLTGRINIGENNPMALSGLVHELTHKNEWPAFQAAMDAAMARGDQDAAIMLSTAFESRATAAEALYLGAEGLLGTLGAGGQYMGVAELIQLYQYCASQTGYNKQNQAPVEDMYQCLVTGVSVQFPYVFSEAYAQQYRDQWSASHGGFGGGGGGGGGGGWGGGGFFPDYSGLRSIVIGNDLNGLNLTSAKLNADAVAHNEAATGLIQALAGFMLEPSSEFLNAPGQHMFGQNFAQL